MSILKKMSKIRSIDNIPAKYRSIFSSIKNFNSVQCETFDDVFTTKKHIVVSAPTGSGKTKIFELAIVELLMSLECDPDCELENTKIVYVAPTKALCNEIYQTWRLKLKPFNMNVALVTGDSDPIEMANLSDLATYQIAVTTPEKWDAMTRKWKDHRDIVTAVRLVLIDEVQLVGDTFRGPTVEAIVARMKSVQNESNARQVRFISVSASLPNIEDIAKWISAGQPSDSVCVFRIDESKRPVKLTRRVMGYNSSSGNSFQFNISLTYELSKIVNRLLIEIKQEEQILIFCQSRYDVEFSLDHLVKNIQLPLNEKHRSALNDVSQRIKDDKLRASVKLGFAYHHAGLTYEDREYIESIYRDGIIKILLSTNTLAVGVNLPAHTVIIKSTEMFAQGTNQEVSEAIIIQMIGRAGRQQYNTSGRAYIMTKQEKVKHYENLVVDTVQIESHLSKKLAEFLNIEIALHTITDNNASLLQWLKTTFLYARTTKKLPANEADAKLKDLGMQAIDELKCSELIEIKADGSLFILPYGEVMAKHFLSIRTMRTFKAFRGTETIQDILEKVTNCHELTEIYFRRDELKILNDINSGRTGKRIRYLIPGKIQTSQQKVSCLLQALLSNVPVNSTALHMNGQKIIQIAERLANAMNEYFRADQFTGCCFNAIHSSIVLAKSLRTRTWSDIQVFGQLKITEEDAAKLVASDINTIDALLKSNPREIEDILKKEIPYGNEFIDETSKHFPCYDVKIINVTDHVINICVAQSNIFYEAEQDTRLTLLVGDSCNRLILCEDIQPVLNETGICEKLLSYSTDASDGIVHLIHHNIVGVDKMVKFKREMASTAKLSTIMKDLSDKTSIKTVHVKKKPLPRESFKTQSTKSSDQPTLAKYFPSVKNKFKVHRTSTMKSVFDKSKVEAIKKINRSPDLFITQAQNSQMPTDTLYTFGNTQFSSPHTMNSNIKLYSPTQPNDSLLLAETPIQNKIRMQQLVQDHFADGFVSANNIFSVARKTSIDWRKPYMSQPPENDSTENHVQCDTSKRPICELDEDFIEMIHDELEELHSSGQKLSLEEASCLKKNSENTLREILDQYVDSATISKIKYDFDDFSDSFEEEVINLDQSFWEIFPDEIEKDDTEKRGDKSPAGNQQVQRIRENDPDQTNTAKSQCMDVPVHATSLSFRKPHNSSVTSHSQDSDSSNRAVCGSPRQNEPGSDSSKMKRKINDFEFKSKSQMQSTVLRKNNMQRRKDFMGTEPPIEVKKPKIDLHDMIANRERKDNEYAESLRNLKLKIRPPMKQLQQAVGKTSLKNTFTRMTRDDDKSEEVLNELIRQCQERRNIDEDYKRNGYNLDFIRYKVLKLLPKNSDVQSYEKNTRKLIDDNVSSASDSAFESSNDDLFHFATQESYSPFFNS